MIIYNFHLYAIWGALSLCHWHLCRSAALSAANSPVSWLFTKYDSRQRLIDVCLYSCKQFHQLKRSRELKQREVVLPMQESRGRGFSIPHKQDWKCVLIYWWFLSMNMLPCTGLSRNAKITSFGYAILSFIRMRKACARLHWFLSSEASHQVFTSQVYLKSKVPSSNM